MKAMSDLGLSPTAIAEKLGRSHNTVIKYLDSDVYNDPTISLIVEKIRENEINDLYLLGAKGRKRLHELVDSGNSKMIETIALVDRVFQQRRLLEGKSTENISSITRIAEQGFQDALAMGQKQLGKPEKGKSKENIRETRERASKRQEGEEATVKWQGI